MRPTLLAASLLIASALFVPGAAGQYHCQQSVVSDGSATWTHLETHTGAAGPAQGQSHAGWATIAGATPIWRSGDGNHAPTLTPVVFTQTFVSPWPAVDPGVFPCIVQGHFQMVGDNSYVAQINGVTVAACGGGPTPSPDEWVLGSCHQRVFAVPIGTGQILPAPAVNVITVLAWNYIGEASTGGPYLFPPSPAMVAYRLDY